MEKTFDDLLLDIWDKHNIPDVSHEVKLAIVKALAPSFISTTYELAESYHYQELADEDLDQAMTELVNTTFCITPGIYEAIDREFDFVEWVENAEGPPAMGSIHRCWNCGAPLTETDSANCYDCSANLD